MIHTSADLLVPYALDEQSHEVFPEGASPRKDYQCPYCFGAVRRRAGQKVRVHFYHLSGREGASCAENGPSRETREHDTTKRRIALLMQGILDGNAAPAAVLTCPICSTHNPITLRLPTFDDVIVEGRVEGTHLRSDVLLKMNGRPVFAFEIRATHAVCASKVEAMRIPWLETSANNAIEELSIIAGTLASTDIDYCCSVECGATRGEMENPPSLHAIALNAQEHILEVAEKVIVERLEASVRGPCYINAVENEVRRLAQVRYRVTFKGAVVRALIDNKERYFDGTRRLAVEVSRSEAMLRVGSMQSSSMAVSKPAPKGKNGTKRKSGSTYRILPENEKRRVTELGKNIACRGDHWYPLSPCVYRETDLARPNWRRDWYYNKWGVVYGCRVFERTSAGQWMVFNEPNKGGVLPRVVAQAIAEALGISTELIGARSGCLR